MITKDMAKQVEKYGRDTLAVVLDPINSKFTSIAIVQCDELCNLNGGRELFRFKKDELMPTMKLHGEVIKPELILTTPNCKGLAKRVAEKYAPCPVQMLFENK